MKTILRGMIAMLCVMWNSAQAQYPAKPVRLVVAFPPGGASDMAARTVTRHMFGNGVVVDNRPGGHGVTAVRAVWTATPDGYTLLWGIGSMVALPLLWQDFPIKSMGELQPVAMAAQLVYGMFVYPGLPVKSAGEFAAYARTRSETFASAALSEHLAASKFMLAAKVEMTRVGYKGGVQVIPDLASGRVAVNFAPASPMVPLVRDGRLRILGVLEPQRVAAFPDVPTMAEAGFPTVTVAGWQALFAPPGTPVALVNLLAQRVLAAAQDDTVRGQMQQALIRPRPEATAALARIVIDDVSMWQKFIKDYQITAE